MPVSPSRSVVLALLLIGCGTDDTKPTDTSTPTIPPGSTTGSVTGAPTGTPTTSTPTVPTTGAIVPLFDASTPLNRPVLEDTGTALITRFGDRGRDRHAREDVFAAYDHYLSHYWEFRTVSVEIFDTVGRDPSGGEVRFEVTTEYKLSDNEAELRFFYRGLNTVAEYHNNGVMTPLSDTFYTRSVSVHGATGAPLQVGDEMEFELSQFLDASVEAFGGRAAYYGTTYLYVVGTGLVPWEADVVYGTDQCPCDSEISRPIPEDAWLGGRTTLPIATSNEPRHQLMQMATNLAGDNAQPFVLGRRLVHTHFGDGTHSENGYAGGTFVDNPPYTEQVGKLGPHYIHQSCDACHVQNTRALPPPAGTALDQYVVKIGNAQGGAHPTAGRVLQVGDDLGASEGTVTLASWTEAGGLRTPTYSFTGTTPDQHSARIAPQLVGMGLLEAIVESDVAALADPNDADGDGISGRMRVVVDPETGNARLGRFGYKAGQATVRHQVAAALNTDMGVMTDVFPDPDCGPSQTDCGPSGTELDAQHLDDLTVYVSLLGIRPQRDHADPTVAAGRTHFEDIGCAACHTPSFQTSAHAPLAELRDQAIQPYTDLLLHDMGPELADSLAEGDADGAEWRTAPLWSVGLTPEVNGAEAYLHDGRARTLDEAIRWHGGEGEASRDAYLALTPAERDAVVAFVRSL